MMVKVLLKGIPQLEKKSIISHFAVSFFKPILTTGVFIFLSSVLSPSYTLSDCVSLGMSSHSNPSDRNG